MHNRGLSRFYIALLAILMIGGCGFGIYVNWWVTAIIAVLAGFVFLRWVYSDHPENDSPNVTPIDPYLVSLNNQKIYILEEIRKLPENKRARLWKHYHQLDTKEKQYKETAGG